MKSVKYHKLQMEESEDEKIDFSSPFFYETKNLQRKYQSIFSYNDSQNSSVVQLEFEQTPLSTRLGHWIVLVASFLIFLLTLPISIWLSFKIVPEHKRLVVFRLGWMLKAKGPGIVFVFPLIDRHHLVDIRTRAFNVPPQQLLTVDGAAIEVGADVYLKIVDVQKSVTCVQDLNHSTRLLVQMALVKQLTQRPLEDIERQKAIIVNTVQVDCNKVASNWGVEINRCELSLVKVLMAPSNSKASLPKCLMSNQEKNLSSFPSSSLPTPLKQLSLALMNGKLSKGSKSCHEKETSIDEKSTQNETEKILFLLQSAISEDFIQSIHSVYQINIESEETPSSKMNFILDLKNGTGNVKQGTSAMVDATLTLTIGDFMDMVHGQLKPLTAYMNGRLKVSGNIKSALKLDPFLVRLRNTE